MPDQPDRENELRETKNGGQSDDNTTSNTTERPEQKRRIRSYQFRVYTLIFDGLLVLVGAIYSFFSYQQWRASTNATQIAQDALRLASENARLDQRAWVTVTEVHLEKAIVPWESPKLSLAIVNSGKTPALVDVFGRIGYGPEPPPSSSVIHGVFEPCVIGPSESIAIVPKFDVPVLSKESVEALRNSTIHLYAKGWIIYRDIFKQPHKTTFCFMIDGNAIDGKSENERYMKTCEGATAD